MAEWIYAQSDPAEELAELHFFSFKKRRPEGDIEFVITVKEFASRNALQMQFYATRRSTRGPHRSGPLAGGIRCCAHSANASRPSASTPTIQNNDQ